MVVTDASALLPALADDGPFGRRARERLLGEELTAPELVDLEVGAALRRLEAAGGLSTTRARQAFASLEELPLARARHRPLLSRCWELRSDLTFYDASYVALAEALDAVLITADGRLARAPGPRCTIEQLA